MYISNNSFEELDLRFRSNLINSIVGIKQASLVGTINSNNLTNYTVFSTPLVSMNGYGEAGMPKVVILGGNDHRIGYHQNNSGFSDSAMTNVISTFLNTASVVNEDSFKNSISIYPNPTSDKLYIDGLVIQDVVIYSVLGKEVVKISNQNSIDVSSLSKGVYFIKVSDGVNSSTKKFIKN